MRQTRSCSRALSGPAKRRRCNHFSAARGYQGGARISRLDLVTTPHSADSTILQGRAGCSPCNRTQRSTVFSLATRSASAQIAFSTRCRFYPQSHRCETRCARTEPAPRAIAQQLALKEHQHAQTASQPSTAGEQPISTANTRSRSRRVARVMGGVSRLRW